MATTLRTRLGVAAGQLAGGLSRGLGRGAGATLPGRVTLAIAPGALAELAAGRTSIVITGTNGKTTTTAFLVAALEGDDAAVVTNTTGANLPTGIVAALATSDAPLAVLETDELHVPAVVRAVHPSTLVLLNLSRDQLDRTHEVRRAADLWRTTIAEADRPLTVIANAADPNIAYALLDGAATDTTPVWVDGGLRWFGDAELCPRCGLLLTVDDEAWHCTCGLRQPDADFAVGGNAAAGFRLRLPDGSDLALAPALPGAANVSNAAFAIAAATTCGVDASVAADRLAAIDDVAGRYARIPLGSGSGTRPARMLLAKNPAGWTVSLDLIGPEAVVALGVNARLQDGTDTSWLWDVPFERLAGRTVGVFGDRAADLELRLRHAGVDTVRAPGRGNVADAHTLADDLPPGDLTVLATYTAFQEVRRGG